MKRKKKPLTNTTIAYLAVGIVLVSVMALFAISSFFKVNNIRVDGMRLYSAQIIAEASDVSKGDNLFFLNRSRVADRISEQLPYVNSVEIRRDYPDTLIIEVTESKASAYIRFGGEMVVIDSAGRILATGNESIIDLGDQKLTEVRGVPLVEARAGSRPVVAQGTEPGFSAMQSILEVMERENLLGDVNYLDVGSITNISFGYLDMYRVLIGGLHSFNQKLAGLPSEIRLIQERSPNVRGVYDMTDPSGKYKFTPDD